MGHVLRLAPVTQTKHYYCQTPIDGDTVCGFRWTLDVPSAGKVNYRLACMRCGHAYPLTVKATKPPRPPKPRKPTPKPVCHHDRGRGYVDQIGRQRCSACGAIIKNGATDGTS